MSSLCLSLVGMMMGCNSPSFTLIIQATIARPSQDEIFAVIAAIDHCGRLLLEPCCSDFRSRLVPLPKLSLQLTYFDFDNYVVLSAVPFLVDLIMMQGPEANLDYFQIHMLRVIRHLLLPALQLLEDQC